MDSVSNQNVAKKERKESVNNAIGFCQNAALERFGERAMAIPSLRDLLRWLHGGDKKEKSVFASEQEAYEWCQEAYKDSGGVTPELRRAYEFYKKNYDDDCPPVS